MTVQEMADLHIKQIEKEGIENYLSAVKEALDYFHLLELDLIREATREADFNSQQFEISCLVEGLSKDVAAYKNT